MDCEEAFGAFSELPALDGDAAEPGLEPEDVTELPAGDLLDEDTAEVPSRGKTASVVLPQLQTPVRRPVCVLVAVLTVVH